MRILLVEDDDYSAEILRRGLEEEGHAVVIASNGADGYYCARHSQLDVIILDVMLPGMDGWAITRKLRQDVNLTPILILTACDSETDIVHGLNLGADDYLTKPFSFEVLLARIRALARRSPVTHPVCLRCGDVTVDEVSHEVKRAGQPLPLTRTEFNLMRLLVARARSVVTRDTLIQEVWGFDAEVNPNTLDTFMRTLRLKVDRGYATPLIHTVRGIGYCFREQPE